jgi:hypothetical protein
LLPNHFGFQQRESNPLLIPKPFPPKVKRLFCKALVLTKPRYRFTTPLLRLDLYAPVSTS